MLESQKRFVNGESTTKQEADHESRAAERLFDEKKAPKTYLRGFRSRSFME
jgi:hypothetical protein